MKRWTIIIMVCLVATVWLSWGVIWTSSDHTSDHHSASDWQSNVLITHALGGIDGRSYTNSYESLTVNYDRGYRVFEADLLLSSDGRLVARHDWSNKLQPNADQSQGRILSLDQFSSSLIYGQYKPLTFSELLQFLKQHPDMYLVTDTKETKPELIRAQFEQMHREAEEIDLQLLDRIIPEIYSPEMYDAVMEIYPFPNKLYSIYKSNASPQEIIQFVQDKQISSVAMPMYRVLINPNLVSHLNKLGVASYVHTVNNKSFMQLLYAVGVHGVYTDLEEPADQLTYTATHNNKSLMEYAFVVMASLSTILIRVRRK